VSLVPPPDVLVGVDIGATKIAAGVGASDGRILERLVVPTPREDPERLVDAVAGLVSRLRRGRPGLAAVGVGTCGRVDPVSRVVSSSIALGWPRPVPLGAMLAAHTGGPVLVDNDVNAGALGEQAWGAGRGVDDFIYLGVGTGVGAGIVIGGRLHRGATGAAGEVGHMVIDLDGPPCPCGNRGCLEVLAGGKALGLAASADIAPGSALAEVAHTRGAVTARDVLEAASRGDAHAGRLVRRTGEYLAVAIVNLVNVFDPQRVILGGGLTQTGDLLVVAVRAALGRWTACFADGRKALVPAALGGDAALAGAVAVARQGLDARP
jgi:glucokinase